MLRKSDSINNGIGMGNDDYDRLINELMETGDSVSKYFKLERFDSLTAVGIVGYGHYIASSASIASREYISDIEKMCAQHDATSYITAPVFVGGSYNVYYLLFKSQLAYNMFCLKSSSKQLFPLSGSVPHLLN